MGRADSYRSLTLTHTDSSSISTVWRADPGLTGPVQYPG